MVKSKKYKKSALHGRLYTGLLLVRERVSRWNPLCHNLLTLGNKLAELGLVYSDCKVVHLVHATEESCERFSSSKLAPGEAERTHPPTGRKVRPFLAVDGHNVEAAR
jgi:hypothetical protein